MINVNQITAQLARMPDQALQQYAQMNKSDPYILSLALSESNRRKQMREGAQMAAPEQPKVVDQAIAGMAAPMPEDVGIGQLPAGNMEFAAGGIVAFDEGGEVPRFNGETGSYLFPEGSLLGRFQRGTLPQGGYLGAIPEGGFFDTTTEARRLQALQIEAERRRNEERNAAFNRAAAIQDAAGASTVIPTSATPAAAAAKPETSAARLGPGTASAQTPTLLGGPGTAQPAPTGIAGLASTPSTLRREFEAFMPEGATTLADIERQTREVGEEGIAAAKTRKELREKQLAEMGLFGVEQEKRLGERKGRIEKQEKELGGLSLLQAGLAMMSGTSPNALQNIGIGAQVGLKTYGEGVDKLENAKEKLDDAFGRLEAARRSERILTDKEKAELESDYNKAKIEAKRLTLDGARQAYGLNQQQAGKLFEAYTANQRLGAELGARAELTDKQIQAQKDIAAGRSQLMRDLYGGDIKARAEFGKIQTKVMGDLQKDSTYQLADPAKKAQMETEALRRAIQNNPFLASYAAGIGFTKAPPPGKVYDLTE